MPRPPVQQWSNKPRQPETVSSKRPKLLALQPSEMLRPRGPPRQSHSKGNMATSCRIWRHKSSNRRAKVKLTSSLPARPICMPAHWSSRALWLPPTTFYWGRHLHHLCPIAEDFPSGRTACFSHSSHTSAQAAS